MLDTERLFVFPRGMTSSESANQASLFEPQPRLPRRAAFALQPAAPRVSTASQRSFDELGTPLAEVTFCVLDLETTGGSADTCHITEIGAVKVRGGEVLGTFQTMVNPGVAIPPTITMLTGITDQLVCRAPAIDQVLPTFLEFIGGAVIVGHNVRFDMSFIQAAIQRCGGPLLGNQRLDTLALARRLLAGETPKFNLGVLATRLRLPHQPSHRALDDALATVDLLHYLVERASSWGVTGLDDLINLPTIAGHPQARKLKLTTNLPRTPGVYQFVDADGKVLYVGKATNLRARVRSYFSTDTRAKIGQLLRQTATVRYEESPTPLSAELTEIRLIQEHQPIFNKAGKRAKTAVYVKLTTAEAFPRLAITKSSDSPGLYFGPMVSRREANNVVDAIHSALPIRRCSRRLRKGQLAPTDAMCTAGQLGVALCPCSGAVTETEYQRVVDSVTRAILGESELVLEPLDQKMMNLAAAERFEEAAEMRNRAAAFANVMQRKRKLAMLDHVATLTLETQTGAQIRFEAGGQLVGHPPASLDEALCISSWLTRNASKLTLIDLDGELSSPLPAIPSYKPKET